MHPTPILRAASKQCTGSYSNHYLRNAAWCRHSDRHSKAVFTHKIVGGVCANDITAAKFHRCCVERLHGVGTVTGDDVQQSVPIQALAWLVLVLSIVMVLVLALTFWWNLSSGLHRY